MKQYFYTLGNVVSRKGHRGDCEHIQVTLEVFAEDEADALAELRVGNGTLVSYESGGTKGLPKPKLSTGALKAAE